MGIGMRELLVILVVCLVVFGAKKLRTVGSDLGHAVRGFKKAMNEGENEEAATPPKRAMNDPAAVTPWKRSRLTAVAVKMPSGVAAPNWRNALARTAEDCAVLLTLMAGVDPEDPTAVSGPVPDYAAATTQSMTCAPSCLVASATRSLMRTAAKPMVPVGAE